MVQTGLGEERRVKCNEERTKKARVGRERQERRRLVQAGHGKGKETVECKEDRKYKARVSQKKRRGVQTGHGRRKETVSCKAEEKNKTARVSGREARENILQEQEREGGRWRKEKEDAAQEKGRNEAKKKQKQERSVECRKGRRKGRYRPVRQELQ